ncbi:MAG: nucleoside-diphosphate kinase [Verrucomicrobia bacterium]|nr:nucleoside-diphosphate kinase [Verrucomicrobiota bacterium]
MNDNSNLVDEILTGLKACTKNSTRAQQWIRPYSGGFDTASQHFVLFLKPEVTALHLNVDVEAVLKLVTDELTRWEVQTAGVRVLSAAYLREHQIMNNHYGVINSISLNGRKAITAAADNKLVELFRIQLEQGAEVLGGHQFLERFPDFTPFGLSILSDNVGTKKLGGGTYALPVSMNGAFFIVLNPFHPYQLEPYTTDGRAIVVFECASDRPWSELRRNLAGATDPSEAAEGSIRQKFLDAKEALNLADVSQGANGIHLSAGPLEGMVEIQRFFTDHESGKVLGYADTCFGRLLESDAPGLDLPRTFSANPGVSADGDQQSAFDLTEEMDAVVAASLLSRAEVLA